MLNNPGNRNSEKFDSGGSSYSVIWQPHKNIKNVTKYLVIHIWIYTFGS